MFDYIFIVYLLQVIVCKNIVFKRVWNLIYILGIKSGRKYFLLVYDNYIDIIQYICILIKNILIIVFILIQVLLFEVEWDNIDKEFMEKWNFLNCFVVLEGK